VPVNFLRRHLFKTPLLLHLFASRSERTQKAAARFALVFSFLLQTSAMLLRLASLLTLNLALFLPIPQTTSSAVIDFEKDGGAVRDDASLGIAWKNGAILNATLAALQPGDMLIIPNATFHLMGGCVSNNLTDAAIQIDGTIVFSGDTVQWPRSPDGKSVLECLQFNSPRNVTITSSGRGRLVGSGAAWWSLGPLGYLLHGENRPRLLHIWRGRDITVERIWLDQSPYWTFWAEQVDGLVVR
jgi:hypothetical protein